LICFFNDIPLWVYTGYPDIRYPKSSYYKGISVILGGFLGYMIGVIPIYDLQEEVIIGLKLNILGGFRIWNRR